MNRSTLLALSTGLLLTASATACQKEASTSAPSASPPTPALTTTPSTTTAGAPADPQANAVITLVDAGSEPRIALGLAPGAAEHGQAAVRLDERMNLSGKPLPNPALNPVRFTLDAAAGAAGEDGRVAWSVTLADAVAIDFEAAPEPAKRLLEPVLEGLRGQKLTARVSPSGQAAVDRFVPPATAKVQVQRLMESYVQVLGNLPTPVPTEPVGVGARWQVTQAVESGRLTVTQKADYALVALDGDKATVNVTYTSERADDTSTPPGMPPGTKVKAFSGSGKGVKLLQAGRFLPVTANVNLHMEVELELPRPGAPEPGQLKVAMNLGLTVGDPAPVPDAAPEPAPEPPSGDDPHGHEGHHH